MEPAQTGSRRHRPGPRASDERRAALLHALGTLLDDASLGQIRITDITKRAGVQRSAFYFYFESKAAAAAEMLSDVYSGVLTLNEWFTEHDGEPTAQLRHGFAANVSAWRERAKMLVAMLDAVYTDEGVREVWDHWRAEHIRLIADRIRHDRDAGLVTSSTEPDTLAQLLLGALFAAMEEDVRAYVSGGRTQPGLDTAIAELWSRAVYG
jgi:AcrR family transcriptional regulator